MRAGEAGREMVRDGRRNNVEVRLTADCPPARRRVRKVVLVIVPKLMQIRADIRTNCPEFDVEKQSMSRPVSEPEPVYQGQKQQSDDLQVACMAHILTQLTPSHRVDCLGWSNPTPQLLAHAGRASSVQGPVPGELTTKPRCFSRYLNHPAHHQSLRPGFSFVINT